MEQNNKFIVIETDQTAQKCTAMLTNFSVNSQRIAVGQFVSSQTFEMTCPKIGKSLWSLIVFPNGQYDLEIGNGQVGVYLKLLACEHESEQILVDVILFIQSEDRFSTVLLGTTFQYDNPNTRWVGTNLISKSELCAQANCDSLMPDDNLIIGFRLVHPELKSTVRDKVEMIEKQSCETTSNSLRSNGDRSSTSLPSSSHMSLVNGLEEMTLASTNTSITDKRRRRVGKKIIHGPTGLII